MNTTYEEMFKLACDQGNTTHSHTGALYIHSTGRNFKL